MEDFQKIVYIILHEISSGNILNSTDIPSNRPFAKSLSSSHVDFERYFQYVEWSQTTWCSATENFVGQHGDLIFYSLRDPQPIGILAHHH